MYPADGVDVDTLLRNADLAMYFAKRKGPGMYAFFDAAMNDAALHRFTLEASCAARWSAASSPCTTSRNSTSAAASLSGMEALLRWTNDELGVVPPESSSFRWPRRPD
jgi:predicted signal transduction protein with EAL and GGDEF domain